MARSRSNRLRDLRLFQSRCYCLPSREE